MLTQPETRPQTIVRSLSSIPQNMLAYDSPPPTYPPLRDSQLTNNNNNTNTPVYDPRGRQKHYLESAMQRQDRIEFIKRREWARRVTEWVRETNYQKGMTTTFGVPQRPLATYDPSPRAQYDTASQASVIPFPRSDEEEPYIIYSSSPASSLSSLSEDVPVLPLNSGPAAPSLTVGAGGVQSTQRRSSGHHRRCSSSSLRAHTRRPSLSSIRELPEED